jgi:hypothetical protein
MAILCGDAVLLSCTSIYALPHVSIHDIPVRGAIDKRFRATPRHSNVTSPYSNNKSHCSHIGPCFPTVAWHVQYIRPDKKLMHNRMNPPWAISHSQLFYVHPFPMSGRLEAMQMHCLSGRSSPWNTLPGRHPSISYSWQDTVVGFTQLLPYAVLSWRSLTAHGALLPHKNSNYNMPRSSVRVDTSILLSCASMVMLSMFTVPAG